jgi:hypothetical protein
MGLTSFFRTIPWPGVVVAASTSVFAAYLLIAKDKSGVDTGTKTNFVDLDRNFDRLEKTFDRLEKTFDVRFDGLERIVLGAIRDNSFVKALDDTHVEIHPES